MNRVYIPPPWNRRSHLAILPQDDADDDTYAVRLPDFIARRTAPAVADNLAGAAPPSRRRLPRCEHCSAPSLPASLSRRAPLTIAARRSSSRALAAGHVHGRERGAPPVRRHGLEGELLHALAAGHICHVREGKFAEKGRN